MTVEMYSKRGGTIFITQHDESEVTDFCTECEGPLVEPPSKMTMLKVNKPLCWKCSGTGAPWPL